MKIFKPFTIKLLVLMVLLIIFFNPKIVFSSDRPFNNGSNWGGTGLMEIPNARILEDGVVRLGAAQALPFRWYYGGMGVLPGFEFTGRITEMTNIPAEGFGPDYGGEKDKSVHLKYQIFPETKELPALAIGFDDFWGTGQFPNEYLVISRQIYPFDFTFGIGSKRLSGGAVKFINDDYSLFGGFELELNERFHFMAEYNPIKYENEKSVAFRGVPEGAKYPVNVGLRVKIIKGIEMGVSFQRGDTFGVSLNATSLLGEHILPQAPDPAPLLPVDRRVFDERENKEIVQSIYDAVKKSGLDVVAVSTDGRNIICEFQNNKYFSNQKAVGRVLRDLLFYSPEDTKLLSVIAKSDNISVLKVSVNPDHLDKFLLGEISEDTFVNKLLKVEITGDNIDSGYIRVADDDGYNFNYDIKPDLDIYWNDPSGFLKFSTGISPYFTADLWKGASAYVRFSVPFYSNITSPSTEELPADVVRSDIAKYKEDNYTFDKLMLNQVFRFSDRWFGRVSLGYFESMYAGIGGETLYFSGSGKFAFGVESDWVKKREPETLFKLMDVDRHTLLGTAYYHYSGLDMTFKTQFGRFLAGDVGWKIDINRRYKTGVTLGMFVTFTDTDDIDQPWFNDDYNHKGIYLKIPIRMFYTNDSNRTLNYGISPWTRDVGQTVSHWKDLYSIVSDLMPSRFKAEPESLKD